MYLLLFAGFAILCFALYRPALEGDFVSDDLTVLRDNPFITTLSFENVASIFDIGASEKSFTGNYAPINELMMALERHYFGPRVFPYHAVNILLHALNSVLLIAWLRSSRLPLVGALLGGLIFVLHPANVEAVAWMSQLKTVSALTFSLAALLLFRRAPLAGTLFFSVALLTKASALFALPTAAVFTWARRGEVGGGARHWAWVAAWAVIFGLYAIPEFSSFRMFGESEARSYPDAAVHLRSIAGYGSRYLVMATTSYGLSAFHEPEAAHSILDPWWLAALPAAGLFVWRLTVVSLRRSEEAAYWVAAAASFAPISQIFPFIYPMGDRYLYFVLPGLIGGSLFLASDARTRLASMRATGSASLPSPATTSRVAIACVLALSVFFGTRSVERAGVWRNETRLFLDAERHYPDGGPANLLRARRAAQMGDVAGAIEALQGAEAAGLTDFMILPNDPALAPIIGTKEFYDFVRGMAARWIERSRHWGSMNQAEYHMLAHAHIIRDETVEAEAALEKAIAAGGPQEEVLRSELTELRF
ncbi:MAG: hypothetical protein JRG80_03820 [Deltaproteobacteria bacterium]|nr:hypothetical protein [Deltaproteobacteria bacterium]MBW2398382.1 hypothetical protein [Deltaproteobacteria bacterium]